MAKKATKKAAKAADSGDVINRDKYKYDGYELKTKDGKKKRGRDNGDRIAEATRGLSADDVIKAVKANGGEANPKWDSLNEGMKRMAAGNALRAIVRSGKTVEVGGKRVASLGG